MAVARDELSRLATDYFAAVDRKDMEATLAFFQPDASFTIATFGVTYQGRDTELRGMFQRLFDRYAFIWHGNFEHVVEPPQRIATRFDVENRSAEGQVFRKHNANFFHLRDGKFAQVQVYMSGDNALR